MLADEGATRPGLAAEGTPRSPAEKPFENMLKSGSSYASAVLGPTNVEDRGAHSASSSWAAQPAGAKAAPRIQWADEISAKSSIIIARNSGSSTTGREHTGSRKLGLVTGLGIADVRDSYEVAEIKEHVTRGGMQGRRIRPRHLRATTRGVCHLRTRRSCRTHG